MAVEASTYLYHRQATEAIQSLEEKASVDWSPLRLMSACSQLAQYSLDSGLSDGAAMGVA